MGRIGRAIAPFDVPILVLEQIQKFQRESVPEECWLWIRTQLSPSGYALVPNLHGRGILVHRASYVLAYGPLAAGMDIHHTCGNRSCFNPSHLESVDISTHSKTHHPVLLVCRRGHVKSDPGKHCRQCKYLTWRKRWLSLPVDERRAIMRRKAAKNRENKKATIFGVTL